MRGVGRAVFAAILLLMAGTLNIIYGFGAVGDAHFFAHNTQFVVSNLHTWGWITVILGVIEVVAALSLLAGGAFGRVFGIVAASIGGIGALLSVSGAYPYWSLAVFALCVIIVHGLVVYGEPERV
jgi:hypothetical protein